MLEKIGLPPKPSMRGGSWVVDASHCQGCSSQFTFINRKHHCRRCGGLFCNSCTLQRMVLRGQGDSPVRICNPCKNLEDAARFELRYGKNKAAKGTPKQVQNPEEEILHQILGTDGKQESHTDMISDLVRTSSSASSSSLNEEHIDIGSTCPEELRQQAVEEKNKYRILKGEGKNEEALQAFKRSKELERQAGALEIAIRKNRRMASKASSLASVVSNPKKDGSEESANKKRVSSQKGKEEKGDLSAELRDLGWSDADLNDAQKKPVNLSLEGELSNLIGEISQRSNVSRKTNNIDKSQVVVIKRKALQLKREGKLAEAKEELKRAKILEKQLEEQELLGDEGEDSDDELSALIRSMDDDKHDDLLLNHAPIPSINFDNFLGVGDDITFNDNFDVTDNDMNDPELATALKSFGWSEEDDEQISPNPLDREALQREVLTLKREALNQKREGNVAEAMSLLKKAKLLEKDLETMQVDVQRDETSNEESVVKLPAKGKLAIQKELLALKKKALALRREGRVEEADEELKKGKALEQQLEAMENAPNRPAPKLGTKNLEIPVGPPGNLDLGDEGVDAEVTEQDMQDPALMSVLKNLGWNDDDAEPISMKNSKIKEIPPKLPGRSKTEIQRELLVVKRKALTLRRQGKTEEAEEELERTRVLEEQLADMEASSNSKYAVIESHDIEPSVPQAKTDNLQKAGGGSSSLVIDRKPMDEEIGSNRNNNDSAILQSTVERPKANNSPIDKFSPPTAPVPSISNNSEVEGEVSLSPKEKVLAHKRKAVALKREGKLAEAREELRKAKLLENSLEAENLQSHAPEASSIVQESKTNEQVKKPLSGRDRFKMQQESLAHKRNALKLRREGKIEESEAELELAKSLESQLEESGTQGSSTSANADDVGVEDLIDPQLMSALKSIGWQDGDIGVQPLKKPEPPEKAEPKQNVEKSERSHLEETIKAEKIRALNLKREGKQAEALEALRSAKRLEKKLGSLT